ncbi:uncharacterized protein LOC120683248 [Panicum virgatum]|uniref:Uncharacterized protein n=1 Tax=Panicum virgatum TaxID=38727 RepID=A0A8T0QIJ1_PANVG|nr:uncharacterized protein LOC120683248 [Panicum virgatum]KAG2569974.1 hypothetical protein PVAP13_7NG416800 [Panicum virgatum]
MNKPPAYGHGQGDSPYCCFHPRELVVGVCAHCLKDRLLLLLATTTNNAAADATLRRRRTTSSILALGSSFLQRLDSRHHRADAAADDSDGAASPDDSFISIKFEDNGKATWDSRHKAAASTKSNPPAPVRAVVVEHVAKRGGVTRWRKQVVGRLLQLARWKRSAAVGLDGKKAAGDQRRGRGWIRSLTRRRAAGDRAWS